MARVDEAYLRPALEAMFGGGAAGTATASP